MSLAPLLTGRETLPATDAKIVVELHHIARAIVADLHRTHGNAAVAIHALVGITLDDLRKAHDNPTFPMLTYGQQPKSIR